MKYIVIYIFIVIKLTPYHRILFVSVHLQTPTHIQYNILYIFLVPNNHFCNVQMYQSETIKQNEATPVRDEATIVILFKCPFSYFAVLLRVV